MDVNVITLFFIQFLAMSSLHSGILNFSSGASCVGYMAIVDDLQTLYAVLSRNVWWVIVGLLPAIVNFCQKKRKKERKKKKFGLFLNRVTVSIQEGFFLNVGKIITAIEYPYNYFSLRDL